ncbi:MAG TPA: hypothetical protein DIW47_15850 [Bacteroidetes bacterium]|nr:hypothetical protein [Bacteroidota bacterium]
MKPLLLLILCTLTLFSCKEKINYVLKVDLKQLQLDDLYDRKKVEEVIFDATERNPDSLVAQSRQVFLKGADLLKNQNKPHYAVVEFKKSILIFPQAKTYYELGDALYQAGGSDNLEEAIQAFEIAEHLGFQPAYRVYFHLARTHAALVETNPEKGRKYSIYENLRLAFVNGYSDTSELLASSPFQTVVHSDRYNYLVQNYLGRKEGGKDNIFNVFRQQFGQAQEEFSIDTGEVTMREYNSNISFDFRAYIPEMQNTDFGRDVSHEYFYVATVAENPNYVTLIYSSIDYWSMAMTPVYTTLATFDHDGNRIASIVFSCNCSAEKIKTGRIKGDRIYLEDLERSWLYPIDKVPFDENAVISIESKGKAEYRIIEDGTILEVKASESFNDTTKFTLLEGGKHVR